MVNDSRLLSGCRVQCCKLTGFVYRGKITAKTIYCGTHAEIIRCRLHPRGKRRENPLPYPYKNRLIRWDLPKFVIKGRAARGGPITFR